MCRCAVMLVRCVVARAVHELLLEPKKKTCSPSQHGMNKSRRICTNSCHGQSRSTALAVSLVAHARVAKVENIVCPPRTSQNILTVSEPCETTWLETISLQHAVVRKRTF